MLGAEALTGDLDEVRAMRQAIERGGREERLPEEVWPLGAVAIRGQENRAALIPFVDEVVEILGARRAQRLEAEVVEDEQIGAGVASEAGLARAVGAASAPRS